MSNFLKGYENVANARVTAALVLKIRVADFERLKQNLKSEFPEAEIVFQRVSVGRLWIKEDEAETK
jgi:hypothetical protein